MEKKKKVKSLHEACEQGDMERVKQLVKKRLDINGYDQRHWTPLHCAANARHIALCKYLLQKGANPTLVTANNATPLHYIARMKDGSAELMGLLKLLVEKGSDVNQLNYQRNSPLHEACSRGSLSSASFLLDHGARIDDINLFGETCLHTAIRAGKMELIELLIRKGARVDIVGNEGTPIELADRFLNPIHLDKFRLLVERGSKGVTSSPVRTAYNFNSLPIEVQQMAIESDIKPQAIDQHFSSFLSSVRILHGDSFLPPKPDQGQVILETDPTLSYKLIEESGAGSYGSVFFARSLKIKKKVAIKKIRAGNIKEIKTNCKEIALLSRSQCTNVVTYIESYFLPHSQEHWIITEYMEGGSLHQALRAVLREAEIAYVVKNVLEGIAFMHSKFIVHRDVKSKNIMLDASGDVKLVDFGLAIDMTKTTKIAFSGTPFWMAPEIIRKEPQGPPVDIWALGITILEMANGCAPNFDNRLRAMWMIATDAKFEFDDASVWSKEMAHFVGECLKPNPLDRPSASLLLKHKWLQSSCSREVFRGFINRAFMKNDLEMLGLT